MKRLLLNLVPLVVLPVPIVAASIVSGSAQASWLSFGLSAAFVGLLLFFVLRVAVAWMLVGYALRLPYAALTVAACVLFWMPLPTRWADDSWGIGLIAAAAITGLQLRAALAPTKDAPVDLRSPFPSGAYAVLQGGNSRLVNHHVSARSQRYALDIVRLTRLGRRSIPFVPHALDDYVIFGAPLVSPCEGIIVRADDDAADLPAGSMDQVRPFGNCVVIQTPSGVLVVLAHLQRGSLCVNIGDSVVAGQPIGRAGNSGRTTEPHLHLHAERGGSGVPMRIDGRILRRNSLFGRA